MRNCLAFLVSGVLFVNRPQHLLSGIVSAGNFVGVKAGRLRAVSASISAATSVSGG
jgi:hypothetical protein